MKQEKNTLINKILFVGCPVLLVVVWQILGNCGVINGTILPTPSSIVQTFVQLLKDGSYMEDFVASIRRVFLGFLAGSAAGLVFGILTGLYSKVQSSVSVLFNIIRPIPAVGMVPLMILWFGIGEKSKIIIIAIATFWSVLLNTQEGIANAGSDLVEVAEMLEKSKRTVMTKIVLPAATPSVFTGLRLGVGNAWKSVVAAEMLAATKGIGHMIEYARELAQPGKMFVGLLTIGLIGLLVDEVIMFIQRKTITWV